MVNFSVISHDTGIIENLNLPRNASRGEKLIILVKLDGGNDGRAARQKLVSVVDVCEGSKTSDAL
jgi:hypothetical protein